MQHAITVADVLKVGGIIFMIVAALGLVVWFIS